jgi:hypothetical protein
MLVTFSQKYNFIYVSHIKTSLIIYLWSAKKCGACELNMVITWPGCELTTLTMVRA